MRYAIILLVVASCTDRGAPQPDCHTVATFGQCTGTLHGMLVDKIGVCAVRTETGLRITVLQPTMVGDVVCHYRNGYFKAKGQPLAR